jgi:hypothetical protein
VTSMTGAGGAAMFTTGAGGAATWTWSGRVASALTASSVSCANANVRWWVLGAERVSAGGHGLNLTQSQSLSLHGPSRSSPAWAAWRCPHQPHEAAGADGSGPVEQVSLGSSLAVAAPLAGGSRCSDERSGRADTNVRNLVQGSNECYEGSNKRGVKVVQDMSRHARSSAKGRNLVPTTAHLSNVSLNVCKPKV